MSVIEKAGSEWRQLNLGPFPAPVIDGLDFLAAEDDLSRAALVRRVLTGYVAARFLSDGLAAVADGEQVLPESDVL